MEKHVVKVTELLLNQFGLENLENDEPIFSSNKLDSLDVLRLILALEKEYAIKISPFSVTIDMFDTINSIASLINTKFE